MHGTSIESLIAITSPAMLLATDRALREARDAAFKAGSLSEPLWTLLVGLADHSTGLSFDAIDGGAASRLDRPHLLHCLTLLEQRKLIEAGGVRPAPPLSHVRLTSKGRAMIDAILADTIEQLASQFSHLPTPQLGIA